MHAVLVEVRFKSGRHDDAMRMLQAQVVPDVKGASGFVRGTWFGDTETGHGLMVFQSADEAQQMAGTVTGGDDYPVEIKDVKVYEVTAEA
jgi:hypothetical protein